MAIFTQNIKIKKQINMTSLVGKKAPSFKAGAVVNGGEIVSDFSLDQYLGKKYVVFFFYPKDFTFVCPTELHAFQESLKEFESRGVAVVGCSTDTEESHWGWLQMDKNAGGIKGVTYPIVADTTKTISLAYGTLFGDYDVNDEGELIATGPMIAFRGLYLIDKKGHLRYVHIGEGRYGETEEAICIACTVSMESSNARMHIPKAWIKNRKEISFEAIVSESKRASPATSRKGPNPSKVQPRAR
jgi:peroxiredoxin (alkyl hydroperoxide reductase subunit C)